MRLRPTSMRNLVSLKQRRRLCALLIAVTLLAINLGRTSTSASPVPTENTIILDPANATLLPGTFQVIHAGQGNEYSPHIDCDLASYTYDDFEGSSTVHYQDLLTGADNIVPGDEVDLLSDVSGSRIAYTEVTFDGDTVRLFDISSQTTTILPGFGMSHPAIGGNVVAFEDRGPSITTPGAVDIDAYDVFSGTVVKLAHGSFENRDPDVSPSGNAVVWSQCTGYEVGCNAYSAIKSSPGVFFIRALTTDSQESAFETSTDGELAVYVSTRTGERDIYYQPIGGGNEVHLAIPGDQYSPTIAGGLISFESGPIGATFLCVYDTRTGKLYRVSNDPSDTRLPEISVCGNTGRIVYLSIGSAFDLSGFAFQVPSVPADTQAQLDDLIGLIRSFNLPAGTANSLIRKLQNASDAINASDTATACTLLTSFISECQAQSGKKLTPQQTTQLINSANQIKTSIGCP